jgi:hypothetical protein
MQKGNAQINVLSWNQLFKLFQPVFMYLFTYFKSNDNTLITSQMVILQRDLLIYQYNFNLLV